MTDQIPKVMAKHWLKEGAKTRWHCSHSGSAIDDKWQPSCNEAVAASMVKMAEISGAAEIC